MNLGWAALLTRLRYAALVILFISTGLVCAQELESLDEPAAEPTRTEPKKKSTSPSAGKSTSGGDQEEALYDSEPPPQPAAPKKQERKLPKNVTSLTDLATLAPFEDIAVIQRRFLPKSKRFEFSGVLFTNLNNPFFNAIGGGARVAYYFSERWALEGLFTYASTTTRQVTDDLAAPTNGRAGITTDNIVTSEGYMGGSIKWNPIYGKITWLNKAIVPFDLNFNAGAGVTKTSTGRSEPTIHLGTSQVFAWSKSTAFRWDLMWNMYQATVTYKTSGRQESLNQNDLFLGIGMSFYFPEATYR